MSSRRVEKWLVPTAGNLAPMAPVVAPMYSAENAKRDLAARVEDARKALNGVANSEITFTAPASDDVPSELFEGVDLRFCETGEAPELCQYEVQDVEPVIGNGNEKFITKVFLFQSFAQLRVLKVVTKLGKRCPRRIDQVKRFVRQRARSPKAPTSKTEINKFIIHAISLSTSEPNRLKCRRICKTSTLFPLEW